MLLGARIACGLIALLLAVVSLVVVMQALSVEESQIYPVFAPEETDTIDLSLTSERQRLVANLADAVRFPTVSTAPGVFNTEALLLMRSFLEERKLTLHVLTPPKKK